MQVLFSENCSLLCKAQLPLKDKPKHWLSHCTDQSHLSHFLIQKTPNHNYIVAAGGYSDHGPLQFFISGTRKCLALTMHAILTVTVTHCDLVLWEIIL